MHLLFSYFSITLLGLFLINPVDCRFFINGHFQKCLHDSGSDARLELCTFGQKQEWEYLKNGKIKLKNENRCLDANERIVYVDECDAGSTHQQWTVSGNGIIKNKDFADKCLSTKNPYVANLEVCSKYRNQRWLPTLVRLFVNADSKKCLEDKAGSLRLELCHLGPTQDWQILPDGKVKNRGTTNRCLDASEKYVYMHTCGAENSNQKWVSTEYGQLKNVKFGKCLHPKNPQTTELIACSSGNKDQMWDFNLKLLVANQASQKCLEDSSGSGARVEECSFENEQTWEFWPKGTLINSKTQLCLDASNSDYVYTYECGSTIEDSHQGWTIEGEGNVQIMNKEKEKCLYLKNPYVVGLMACDKSVKNQTWSAVATRVFVNKASGQCLQDGSSKIGDCLNKEEQKWGLYYGGYIYNKKSTHCLAATGNKDGVTFDICGSKNTYQTWKITSEQQIKNDRVGKCLLAKSSTTLQLVSCSSNKDQKWGRKK